MLTPCAFHLKYYLKRVNDSCYVQLVSQRLPSNLSFPSALFILQVSRSEKLVEGILKVEFVAQLIDCSRRTRDNDMSWNRPTLQVKEINQAESYIIVYLDGMRSILEAIDCGIFSSLLGQYTTSSSLNDAVFPQTSHLSQQA